MAEGDVAQWWQKSRPEGAQYSQPEINLRQPEVLGIAQDLGAGEVEQSPHLQKVVLRHKQKPQPEAGWPGWWVGRGGERAPCTYPS